MIYQWKGRRGTRWQTTWQCGVGVRVGVRVSCQWANDKVGKREQSGGSQ